MQMLGSFDSAPLRLTSWRGRSGQTYGLRLLSFNNFVLEPDVLYLIAKGSNALWVGSDEDVIADHASRARFRLALGCADRVFRVETDASDVERMTTIWDLEGAEPESDAVAA